MAGPLRGGGVKGRAIKEKERFWNLFFHLSNFPTTIKLEGGGGKALMARPLRQELFYGFPYSSTWARKVLGSDLKNNETTKFSPLIAQFSSIHVFTKRFCLSIGKKYFVSLFSCFLNPTPGNAPIVP